MCPKPNVTKSGLSKMSHVEDLPEPIPTLFYSLVSEIDSLERWYTLTFPIDLNPTAYNPEIKKDPSTLIRKYLNVCLIILQTIFDERNGLFIFIQKQTNRK